MASKTITWGGPELHRGDRGAQANGAGADDRDDRVWACATELRAVVARRKDITGEQRVFVVGFRRDLDKGRVGERHAHELGLGAVKATTVLHPTEQLADLASGRQSTLTEETGPRSWS